MRRQRRRRGSGDPRARNGGPRETRSADRGTPDATPSLAQHFTPLPVVELTLDLICELYGHLSTPRVIDPACGEGIFLRRAIERGLTLPDRVVGVERDPELALGWSGSPGGPRLIVADALLGLGAPGMEGGFDLVLANPPFGTGSAGLRRLDGPSAERIADSYSLTGGRPERVRRFPAEVLFLELCLKLARPGGHLAIILPEGILANARYRFVREWLLPRFQLDALVSFPAGTFHRTGAAARTALLLITKRPPAADHTVLLAEMTTEMTTAALAAATGVEGDAARHRTTQPQSDPALLHRLDPRYWLSDCDQLLATCRFPLVPLGEFVVHLAYGPIVTGRRYPAAADGVAIVNQAQVRFCGVDLSDAPRVPPDSPWVSPRSMLEPGDVVLPRSGEGSLAKHKVAVFLGEGPATVGSFVDLIRLRGLDPFYLAAFLKSRLGRAQVDRVANGVGVPNISFDEIRGFRVPLLPEARQLAIEHRYRAEVLPHHQAACARHAGLLRAGVKPGADAALSELREVGERGWRGVIEELDCELMGSRGE